MTSTPGSSRFGTTPTNKIATNAIAEAIQQSAATGSIASSIRSYDAQAKDIAASLAAVADYDNIRQLVKAATDSQRIQEQLIAGSIIPVVEAARRDQEDVALSTVATVSRMYDAVAEATANISRAQEAAGEAARLSMSRYSSQLSAISAEAARHQAMYAASFVPAISSYELYRKTATSAALQTRLALLDQGFRMQSGTAADNFGRVLEATTRHPALKASLDSTIRSTQTPGAFGADFVSFRSHAVEVAEAFDEASDDPSLMEPLEALQESTRLEDEVLFDIGDQLGIWTRVTTNRSPTARLILGFTVGLSGFVATSGGGAPFPAAVFEGVMAGSGVYLALTGSAGKTKRSGPPIE